MQFSAKVFTAFRLKLIRKRKQSVASPQFREAVKPPLVVPVFRNRLLSDKNSDFFIHLENLKKLRKHPPRLVSIVEVDFTEGSYLHPKKSNFGYG